MVIIAMNYRIMVFWNAKESNTVNTDVSMKLTAPMSCVPAVRQRKRVLPFIWYLVTKFDFLIS
jgi:hypothetical protein